MLFSYFKTGYRNLLRNKVYTLVNILGLAAGLTTSLLIILYVQHESSFDKHYPNGENIYRMVFTGTRNGTDIHMAKTPAPLAPFVMDNFPEIDNYLRIRIPQSRFTVKHGDNVFYEKGFYFVDSTFQDFFPLNLSHGDTRTCLDQPFSVLLSEEMALKYFGDENPLGKSINADQDLTLAVTGIFEKSDQNSHFDFDFLISFSTIDRWLNPLDGGKKLGDMTTNWWDYSIYTYVIINNEFDPNLLTKKIASSAQENYSDATIPYQVDYEIQPVKDIYLHSNLDWEMGPTGNRLHLKIFSVVALITILIASINFVNLSTASSVKRSKEVGIRKATGAFKSQLIFQFLVESGIIVFVAFILALLISIVLIPFFNHILSSDIRFASLISISNLSILLLLFIFVTLFSGFYPAFIISNYHPASILKGSTPGGQYFFIRKGLVFFQYVITITLLAVLGFVHLQMKFIAQQDLGYDTSHVMTVPLSDPYTSTNFQVLTNKLMNNPNVLKAAKCNRILSEAPWMGSFRKKSQHYDESIAASIITVDYDYIDVMGLEILEGRNFSRDIKSDTTWTVIMNEMAVQKIGLTEPLYETIWWGDTEFKVVGVVKDFYFKSLHHKIEPMIIYLNTFPSHGNWGLIKLNHNDVAKTVATVEASWKEINPNHPFEYGFLDGFEDKMYANESKFQQTFTYFTLVALVIALLGVFGLSSFTAIQKTKEIGIRKILGARVINILCLMSRDFLLLIGLAFFLAVPIAIYFISEWSSLFAYVTSIKVIIFIIAFLAPLILTLTVVILQSGAVATQNPVKCLKTE